MINTSATVGVIILAAGFSTRMGAFKPLLPLGQGTALSTIADAWAAAGVRMRFVVSGHEAKRTEAEALRCGCSCAVTLHLKTVCFPPYCAGSKSARLP